MGQNRSVGGKVAMTVYRNWSWENDCGEEELPDIPETAESFAVVYRDDRGFPYRVVVHNPSDVIRSIDRNDDESFTYDYVYADDGSLIEKRSLDEDGDVFLIVRRVMDANGTVRESAWYAKGEQM